MNFVKFTGITTCRQKVNLNMNLNRMEHRTWQFTEEHVIAFEKHSPCIFSYPRINSIEEHK